ncbi:MAG: hypothetical protein JOZ82_11865, partial [Marmoricola sp.]|nr:hypothetical protein [Marmoricola sp.]
MPDAHGQPAAQFHTEQVLTILEPVRRFPADGSQAARQLPFDELEITTTAYAGLTVPDVWDDQWQADDSVSQPLKDSLTALQDEEAQLAPVVAQQLADAQANTPLVSWEVQQASDALANAEAGLEQANTDVAAWDDSAQQFNQELDDLNRQYDDAVSSGADLGTLAAIQEQEQEVSNSLTSLGPRPSAEVNQAQAAVNQANADLRQAQIDFPPPTPPQDARDLDTDEARRYVDLRDHLVPEAQAAYDAISQKVNRSFEPRDANGPISFPVRGGNPAGDVHFLMPMRFVADNTVPTHADVRFDRVASTLTDPRLGEVLAALPSGHGAASLAGAALDLVRSSVPLPGDVHEVHAIALALADGGLAAPPVLKAMQVKLPSVRTLLPGADHLLNVAYHSDFVQQGEPAAAVLKTISEVVPGFDQPGLSQLVVDFTKDADKAGGVASPKFALDAISRKLGPVNLSALPGASQVPDLQSIFKDAKLLGIDLLSLLPQLPLAPPLIKQAVDAIDHPPTVTMEWQSVKLKSFGPFIGDQAVLTLHATIGVDGATISGTLTSFGLKLPASSPLLQLDVGSLEFTKQPGKPPHLSLHDPKVQFLGDLELLKTLEEKVDIGSAAELVKLSPTGISAGYSLHVPDAKANAFSMTNIDIRAGVDLPFTGGVVTMELAFASRDKPFDLTVLTFGGGGYIDIVLDAGGLQRFEASLDFGARISINLGIASAEVHALGGVRFLKAGDTFGCSGFLRIGGNVDLLGLVSVSIELLVELSYDSGSKQLAGRATLVIEVDLTFWSDSVELDSGTWVLAGGSGAGAPQSVDEPQRAGVGVPGAAPDA